MALPARVMRNLDPLEAMHRDFDNIVGRMFTGREAEGNWMAPYGVDIREDSDHIYVEAELPGFKKEEVEITLENQTLTIAAERRPQEVKSKDGQQTLLQERRYTRFLRSFTLPPTVNEGKCDAKLQDGVLMITLDKREETKPKKITVQ